jgi:hypothetical protein
MRIMDSNGSTARCAATIAAAWKRQQLQQLHVDSSNRSSIATTAAALCSLLATSNGKFFHLLLLFARLHCVQQVQQHSNSSSFLLFTPFVLQTTTCFPCRCCVPQAPLALRPSTAL